MRLAILSAFAALALAAACTETTRADRATEDLGTQISGLRNGTIDHGTHIAAISSLAEIPPEEARHHIDANGHMSGMSSDLTDMIDSCGSLGVGANFDDLRGALADLRRECDGHLLAMDSATDMPHAQAEENRHQSAMTKLLDRMESLRQSMLDPDGHLHCMGGMD